MKIFQNKIVVGVICIVIAAILAFFFLPSISMSKSNTEKIYAVKNAVAEGTKIEESMLVEKEVGSYGLPQSIIKDKDKIIGKYSSCDITPDDLLLSSKLSDYAANQKLDKVMSQGNMLVTVSLDSVASAVGNHLKSGDIISIVGYANDAVVVYLLSDMGLLAKEMMQRELNKRPGRVKMLVIPIVLVAVVALFYVIGANLFSSLGGIM